LPIDDVQNSNAAMGQTQQDSIIRNVSISAVRSIARAIISSVASSTPAQ
jgi:hypothetical protein